LKRTANCTWRVLGGRHGRIDTNIAFTNDAADIGRWLEQEKRDEQRQTDFD
jgi:hypothetical protein